MIFKLTFLFLALSHSAVAQHMTSSQTNDCTSVSQCEVFPSNCRSTLAACSMIVWWRKTDNTKMRIGLAVDARVLGYSANNVMGISTWSTRVYVGIIFSKDGKMITNPGEVCTVKNSGIPMVGKAVFSSQPSTNNIPITEEKTYIENIQKSYTNGVLTCKFDRLFNAGGNSNYALDPSKSYYVLTAFGTKSDLTNLLTHQANHRFVKMDPTTTTKMATTTTKMATATTKMATTATTMIPRSSANSINGEAFVTVGLKSVIFIVAVFLLY